MNGLWRAWRTLRRSPKGYQRAPAGRLRGAGEVARLETRSHAADRAPQQARDVHLRDPDAVSDLALREAGEEAQQDDSALALVEHLERPTQLDALLRELEAGVLLAEPRNRLALLARWLL